MNDYDYFHAIFLIIFVFINVFKYIQTKSIRFDMDKNDVTVLIPTLNEEETIGDVVKRFRNQGFTNILVIDGNSRDKTREIAEKEGAKVVVQQGKGKGLAVIQAIQMIDTPYILMIDGDATYQPEEAEKLLSKLEEGYDQVIGNRLLESNKKAFTKMNFFGNKLLNRFFRLIYHIDFSDIFSGYRAFKTKSIKELTLKEKGFAIEPEITVEALKNIQKIAVVDITYLPRKGKTKLNPIIGGIRDAYVIFELARLQNPFFFFSFFGLIFFVIGTLLILYIIYHWFIGIPHSLLVTLAMLINIIGINFFLTGLLGSIIVNSKIDILRRIKKIAEKEGSI